MIARKQELEKEIERIKSAIEEDITLSQLVYDYWKNKISIKEAELKGIIDTEKHYKEEIEKAFKEVQEYKDANSRTNTAIGTYYFLLKKRLFGEVTKK